MVGCVEGRGMPAMESSFLLFSYATIPAWRWGSLLCGQLHHFLNAAILYTVLCSNQCTTVPPLSLHCHSPFLFVHHVWTPEPHYPPASSVSKQPSSKSFSCCCFSVLPLNWTVGMPGILAATVEDALIVNAAISGNLLGQHAALQPELNLFLLTFTQSITNIKLAKYGEWFNDCTSEIRICCDQALQMLYKHYGWKAREFANELCASTKASRNLTGWLEASTGSGQTANSTDTSTVSEAYSMMLTIFIQILVDEIYKETHEDLWLEYAVSCCFQGIKYGVSNSRSHLARVLYHLSFDTPSETVGRTLVKYLDQLPHWVWLPWIPQLLLSLQRREGPHCKLVLLKIAQVYPQALYYWLRTYLMERRDVANKS